MPAATVDTHEFAQILDVHPRTLRRWARNGEVPKPMQIGRALRWKRSTIEFVDEGASAMTRTWPSALLWTDAARTTW
jgi:predicted DNA-binding transcriptional regulator AlpA